MNRLTPHFLLLAGATTLVAACHRQSSSSSSGAMSASGAPQSSATGDFRAPLGVQLWSFREKAKADGPAAMLAMTRGMGFTHVETAGLYDLTAEQLAAALRTAGLQATSMHVSYEDLKNNPQKVIADAKAVGARYVGLAWYPHTGDFTEADARRAIADFNQFGRTYRDAGLTFFYHNHGFEPVPAVDGTLLDLIIRETDPSL